MMELSGRKKACAPGAIWKPRHCMPFLRCNWYSARLIPKLPIGSTGWQRILDFLSGNGHKRPVAKTDLGNSSPDNWFTPKCGISKKRPIIFKKGSACAGPFFRFQGAGLTGFPCHLLCTITLNRMGFGFVVKGGLGRICAVVMNRFRPGIEPERETVKKTE